MEFNYKIDYRIIELDKTATEEDIKFFKEMYPYSIVIKEDDDNKEEIYLKFKKEV